METRRTYIGTQVRNTLRIQAFITSNLLHNYTNSLVFLAHCLDYLRQVLMCNADYTVFGFYFVKDHSTGMNFNTEHKCKNYDDILAWAENYWLPDDQRMVEQRPGDIILEEYP
jgi:hypothetical protein